MGIISIKELLGRRLTVGSKLERSRKRKFRFKCNTKRQDLMVIYANCPSIGSPFLDIVTGVTDLQSLCSSVDIDQDEKNGFYYVATCGYSKYDTPEDQKPEDPTNPTSTPPRVDGISWAKVKTFIKDKDDAQITNTAGVPFRDPVQKEVKMRGWRVTMRKPLSFDPDACRDFINKTNTASYQGYGARTLWINDITFSEQYDQGIKFREFVWDIHHDPDTWDEVIANLGMMMLDGAGGKIVPATIKGIPVREPVYLHTDGTIADPPVITTVTKKIWSEGSFSSSALGLSGATLA